MADFQYHKTVVGLTAHIKVSVSENQVMGIIGLDEASRRNSDIIALSEDNDILKGGVGDDELFGGPGVDIMYGGSGNDLLSGGRNSDLMYGEAGDDVLHGGDSDPSKYIGNSEFSPIYVPTEIIDGGDGDDWLYADWLD